MKRLSVAAVLVGVILSVMIYCMPVQLANAVPSSADVTCYVFCRQTSENATSIGYGYIVKCGADNLRSVIKNCKYIDGVSLSFRADERCFWQIASACELQNAETERFTGFVSVSGYSAKLAGGLEVGNRRVNLQLVYSDGTVYVGSPLLLGSY